MKNYFMVERVNDVIYQTKCFLSSVPLGFTMTPFVAYFQKYVFSDWETFGIIMTMFMVDTFVGVYKHFRKKTLSKDGFGKFFDKLIVCVVSLFLAEKFATLGDANALWSDLTLAFGRAALIAYLGLSMAENLSELTNGKFPPSWVVNKLKFFNKPKE